MAYQRELSEQAFSLSRLCEPGGLMDQEDLVAVPGHQCKTTEEEKAGEAHNRTTVGQHLINYI
jgi:hypothetical protein